MQRLKLRPSDVVVLTVPGEMHGDAAERVKTLMEAKVPGHQVLVIPDSVKLSILSANERADR